ncbi:histidine phosphatase family protein [Piscinibacter sp. XHJ-5]|uniref:histidine phosphatase family protein n=1 Tax=Piscinibacter sp. XHJ-5 TaxID=3037797 RepID=UPI002452E4DC|nr:histidine phosphatase family protein [Piscinibacter sp. XHJ-5]
MRRLALLALLSCLLVPAAADADEAKAWAALQRGGAVALMRHTDAPGDVGDPPGFRLGDCATQRNLSPRGREDAAAAGRRFKQNRIAFAKVLSSPWCRCVDTATLMDMGPVHEESTFGNVVVLADQREALTAGGRKLIAAWKGRGNLLIVTHGANIVSLAGTSPASGETVVVTPGPGGDLQVQGRIPPP